MLPSAHYDLPSSFAQRALFALHQAFPHLPVAHGCEAMRLRGPLELPALATALDGVVLRHEVLRSSLRADGRGVRQAVFPYGNLPLHVVDVAAWGPDDGARLDRAALLDLADAPFDLEAPGLLRAGLFRIGPLDHVLLVAAHLAIYDRWSRGLFARELSHLYSAATGAAEAPPAPGLQYADFAAWQEECLLSGAYRRELAYWRATLRNLEPLRLPPAGDEGAEPFSCHRAGTVLPRGWIDAAERMARDRRATRFTALASLALALAARLCRRHDVAVAVPVGLRETPELAGVIGRFVNLVTLRAELHPHTTFSTALDGVAPMVAQALHHRRVPFELLVEELAPEANAWSHPWTDVSLTVHENPAAELFLDGLAVSRIELDRGHARHGLELHVTLDRGEARVTVLGARRGLSAAAVSGIAEDFATLAATLAAEPSAGVWAVPLNLDRIERNAA